VKNDGGGDEPAQDQSKSGNGKEKGSGPNRVLEADLTASHWPMEPISYKIGGQGYTTYHCTLCCASNGMHARKFAHDAGA